MRKFIVAGRRGRLSMLSEGSGAVCEDVSFLWLYVTKDECEVLESYSEKVAEDFPEEVFKDVLDCLCSRIRHWIICAQ